MNNNCALTRLLGGLCALLVAGYSQAADWPQYRGPSHDGKSPEKMGNWPVGGPRQLWKVPLNLGFSSFSSSGGRVFTLVSRDIDGIPRESCLALDANTGAELWTAPLSVAKYDGGGDDGAGDNKGGDGPRSTPATDGNFVYVFDARLNLVCLDAKTGKNVWSRDLVKDYGATPIHWQNASSPIIEGDMIFVAGGGPGQALIGFNKKDGKVVWKGQDDKMTHSTPIATTIHGIRQVIFFTQVGLVSVNPKNGDVYWRYPFRFATSTAASPVVSGDTVYCSAGYGVGAGAVKVSKSGDKFEAKEIWRTPGNKLANHWSTPVAKDGYLYGMFQFKEYGRGAVKCVEIATGREVWAQPDFGPGNVTLVDGKLVILGDRGQLVLADPSPEGYKELARFQAIAGKCWSTPVVAGGRILARSVKEGACFEISGKLSKR